MQITCFDGIRFSHCFHREPPRAGKMLPSRPREYWPRGVWVHSSSFFFFRDVAAIALLVKAVLLLQYGIALLVDLAVRE